MIDFLTQLYQTIRLADLFDMALISIMIYVVLIWFKATASRFVLLGIVILGLIYVGARFFHMYLSAVVLQGFFSILLIALVVIFQEELRRFFERISIWGALYRRNEVFLGYPEIQSLTAALSKLARKRIGALVVIKGKDPLDRHLEAGFKLGGHISDALLESIFDPHSIGHDGAVIVEQGRITRFGCHLPLSIDMRKIGNLGTRHSAALGLAERSDALCIAVSEERGTISLAREEKLVELDDPSDLQAELEQFYLEKFPKVDRRTWRVWVRENSREKGLAVLLSCVLWFVFVFQTGTLSRDFAVPIEYRNLASDWVIEEPKPKEATVTLLGRARAFDLLDVTTLKLTLDMSAIVEGVRSYNLSREQVGRLSGLSVVAVEPEEISLSAYRMILADLLVEVNGKGEVPANLELVDIEVSPDKIPVMISQKYFTGSLKVAIDVDLPRILQTITLTQKIDFPPGARFAGDKPPDVKVKVIVREKTPEQPVQPEEPVEAEQP